MDITLKNGSRQGEVTIPASKSQAHRALICAALSKEKSRLYIDGFSNDILATVNCLNAMGADIRMSENVCEVEPIKSVPKSEVALPCGESGSTLRFLLPIVGALGLNAVFKMEGRLPERPLGELESELTRHGMSLKRDGSLLFCSGKLKGGSFLLPGDVSSQYISGLLFAMPLLNEDGFLTVTGKVESKNYILMTEDAIKRSGIRFDKTDKEALTYAVPPRQTYESEKEIKVEADWSSAAFFLCLGALSRGGITVHGLNPLSSQGDRAIIDILRRFGAEVTLNESAYTVRRARLTAQVIDASEIPDLVPVISVVASVSQGESRIVNAGRLRIKESDRLLTTRQMLSSLGANIRETEDGLIINGVYALGGGETNSFNDHRIAMSAAVASAASASPVRISGAECAQKSYPDFFKHFASLKEDA